MIGTFLDVYAEIERAKVSEAQCEKLRTRCRRFHLAFLILLELKRAMLTFDAESAPKEFKMLIQKIHNQHHFADFIELYGCAVHCDTETFEGFHRETSVQGYERTSKCKATVPFQLTDLAISRSRQSLSAIVVGTQTFGSTAKYLMEINKGPKPLYTASTFSILENSRNFLLRKATNGRVMGTLNGTRKRPRVFELDFLFEHTVISGKSFILFIFNPNSSN